MNIRPIVITGFMGSGKTTVARALARMLDCRAIDLDQLIAESERRTPKEIIEQDGEPAFREIETRLLRELLEQDGEQVIALGGGAWTLPGNRDLIAQHNGFSVWLDAPFELCWQRITASGNQRPLARDKGQAQMLYAERLNLYKLAGLQVLAGEGQGVDGLASTIAKALQRR
jgi:shikimate kinase